MSSAIVLVSGVAVGASLLGVTLISKVVVADNIPSETVYVTWGTSPLKLSAGKKV